MRTRVFFKCFILFISGIITGLLLHKLKVLFLALFIIAVLISLIFRKKAVVFLLASLFLLGALRTSFEFKEYTVNYKNITVTGTVVEAIDMNEEVCGYVMLLKNCDFSYENAPDGTRVAVYSNGYTPEKTIYPGYKVKITGNVFPERYKKANFGEFEGKFFALKDQQFHGIWIDECSIIEDNIDGFYKLKNEIRRGLFNNIHDRDSAGVLYAMVTGDKTHVSQEVKEDFMRCGTSHILAVSGLHLSILLGAVTYLLKAVKIKRTYSVFVIGFVIFYSIFTGLSPSVIRASIMAVAVSLALGSGARYDLLNSLSLAGFLILLNSPYELFDPAFQFSFSACFGIAVVSMYCLKLSDGILSSFLKTVIITVGATLFTLPLQIHYSGTVSLVSVLVNIIAVPVASIALTLTFVFLVVYMLGGGVLLKIPGFLMSAVIKINEFFSMGPHVRIVPISAVVCLIIMVIAVFFTRFVHLPAVVKRKTAVVLLLIITVFNGFSAVERINTFRINVPEFSGSDVCVHAKCDGDYLIGLPEERDIGTYAEYVKTNVVKAEALFILNQEDMNVLDLAVQEGLEFEKLYIAPDLIKSKQARMKHAQTVEEKLYLRKFEAEFAFDGFIITFCGKEIYFDTAGNTAPSKRFSVAVTKNKNVKAEKIITYNRDIPSATDIKKTGYKSLLLWR